MSGRLRLQEFNKETVQHTVDALNNKGYDTHIYDNGEEFYVSKDEKNGWCATYVDLRIDSIESLRYTDYSGKDICKTWLQLTIEKLVGRKLG